MIPKYVPARGPGRWQFLPEGVLWHERAKAIVIADLHLGYEMSRARGGDFLPLYTVRNVIDRLQPIFDFTSCETLVVAGDVIESSTAIGRNSNALAELVDWLDRQGVKPVFVKGNHDAKGLGNYPDSVEIDGWVIHHGHDDSAVPGRLHSPEISGHIHPMMRWKGHRFPVFLSTRNRILLPAFSADAAGVDILNTTKFPDSMWADHDCWVCRSGDVVPFGQLRTLRARLADVSASPSTSARQRRTNASRRR
jgi:putative SbcD/Mre11-related phosphoesterase